MNTFTLALRSRTVWTVIVMFLVAGFEGIREVIPDELETYVFGLLGLLATYFRVNAKAK